MIENKKTAHADELEGNRTNSSNEQTYYTGFENLMIRAASKIVECIQGLNGEMRLCREELTKQTTLLKVIADNGKKENDYMVACSELLADIRKNTYECDAHLAPTEAEMHRVVNGLKSIYPEGNFKV